MAASTFLQWIVRRDPDLGEIVSLFLLLPIAGAYSIVLFVLHVITMCALPLSIRLTLIYGTLFICMSMLLRPLEIQVTAMSVVMASPLCWGGLLQRQYGRWHATSWNEPYVAPSEPTIRTLFDITASIAITLCLLPVGHPDTLLAAFCFLPAALILLVVGMHLWARVATMCSESSDQASSWGIWIAGNISAACLVWLLLLITASSNEQRYVGLFVAVAMMFAIHWSTELVVRWLHTWGWKMIRDR